MQPPFWLVGLFFVLWFPALSFAEDVSLYDLLEEARAKNPSILAARSVQSARKELRPQVTSLPDPMLSVAAQLETVETRVGPQRGALGLSQKFPLGGKRKLYGLIADRRTAVAGEVVRATSLEVEARVKKAYYSYWFTRRSREVTREMIALVRSGERVARTRYAAGRGGQETILKAQVELGLLEDRLKTLDEFEPTHVEELLALLDRAPGGSLGDPTAADFVEREVPLTLHELRRRASRLAPQVRGLELQAEQKRLEERLAYKARVPDLTVGVSWIWTDEALNPRLPESGDDPVIATLAVNLPLRYRRYQAAKRERALEREALLRSREGEVNALEANLKRQYFAYTDARRKLSLYRDSLVPKGRQSLEATFSSFQAGRSSFLELLDAERVLLEFELSHARGVADHLKAIAEIDRLVAESVSREVRP